MNEIITNDYLNDLKKIKEAIRTNQNKAMVIVNSAMIMTYYEIGTIINQRKTWGSKYIERLSNDLKEYGKGYSTQNLKYMLRFATEFTKDEFRQQLADKLIPWYTLIEIIYKSKSHAEMLWYVNETHKRGWSRSMVLNQFALKAYERSLIEPTSTDIVKSDELINELFKDTYVFDFVDRNKINNEKDLKDQLIDNIVRFLQELGRGFAFVGREYKLNVGDEDFYIDLLMYNIEIHSYVVLEIKIGKFTPDSIGQLLFYINSVDTYLKSDIEGDTIGLLLCKSDNSIVSKIALKDINKPILVSKYKFIEELPEYLEKRLKEMK